MLAQNINSVSFGGMLGDRLEANLYQWLIPAPLANPGMSEMFRMRDALPRPRLVPWYGEFPGKYITSAVTAYGISGNAALRETVDALIQRLADAQDQEGYLSPHPTAEGLEGHTIEYADNPLMVDLWNLWGYYHLIYGLLGWYDQTGNRQAYALAMRSADYVADAFLSGKCSFDRATAPENFGLAHIYAILHRRTGKQAYGEMAKLVSDAADRRGRLISGIADDQLEYYQLPWPRWEGLHFIQALGERYRYEGDERLIKAFWGVVESIVRYDRHNNGGFSSGENAKGDPYSPEAIETCCTVAWMALLIDAYNLSGESRWIDELELSLFNSMLGAQHPSGRWWTYNTPMDGVRRASAHTIVFQAREGSPELNCCSVNGPRTLGMTAQWGLQVDGNTVDINYYGPSQWHVSLNDGNQVLFHQDTEYPIGNHVRLTVSPMNALDMKLRLRIPGWSQNTLVHVAGERVAARPGEYLEIQRRFDAPVVIELWFDFELYAWEGKNDCEGLASLYRGPILLTWDQRFNQCAPDEIPPLGGERLEAVDKPSWLAPMLLLKDAQSGAILCDFASAGVTGTRYRSWLPLSHTLLPSCWLKD